eukprot:gnl/TRDRNA2_/TRDRNA2_35247_c0_seq1.p1 gnl/TRDRNA2_/TRDRNA2_35247_c0~~gnl/TRDRNA2_/TRDRNA2_35247_c0_seq1.p1  ORF type:complete len:569 (-),score=127.82 gnl/TRDRNA2_/TRDRNA2_35247_c0_seq1:106-1812(-)
MARRIDALYCSQQTAGQTISTIIGEVQARANEVRQEVADAFSERADVLRKRERELLTQIERVASAKVKVLEEQLQAIQAGVCPPAPPEDAEQPQDPNLFLVDADAVINFRTDEEDFKDKIPLFGKIGESSTYASQSYAKGPALGVLKVDNPSFLRIYACDRIGARRKEGGDRIEVTLSSPQDFDNAEVEDLKDGRYKVKFVPLQPGDYTLHIAMGPEGNVEAIRGSPFALTVRPPTNYQMIAQEGDPEGGHKSVFAPVDESAVVNEKSMGLVHNPGGVDFDQSGRYTFVSDQHNHRIQVFDIETNKVLFCFGKKGYGATDFDSPSDVLVDGENRVIVSDLLNHRLQVFEFSSRTLEVRHLCTVGCRGTDDGMFEFPKGLGMTEQGHLLVCDCYNHRVQVFDILDGFRFLRKFGEKGSGEGQFTEPLSVAINYMGEILVADGNHRIQVFDNQGVFLRSFGSKGRKDGLFNYPINIVVDDENALFVCDQGNHRVQVLSASDGSFLHKWGGQKKKPKEAGEGEEEPPAEEGDAAAFVKDDWSGLRSPSGIAVNSHGVIVVCDFHMDKIYTF